MILRSDGVAALFDALMFLAITSVVSVALLSAFTGHAVTEQNGVQERVEATHLVLLRSTMTDGTGNPHSLEELFKLGIIENGRHDGQIVGTLDHLLAGMEWRWSALWAGGTFVTGSPDPPGAAAVYCSLVRAPLDGGEVTFRLEAWPA
jgi:hypothetical protein